MSKLQKLVICKQKLQIDLRSLEQIVASMHNGTEKSEILSRLEALKMRIDEMGRLIDIEE